MLDYTQLIQIKPCEVCDKNVVCFLFGSYVSYHIYSKKNKIILASFAPIIIKEEINKIGVTSPEQDNYILTSVLVNFGTGSIFSHPFTFSIKRYWDSRSSFVVYVCEEDIYKILEHRINFDDIDKEISFKPDWTFNNAVYSAVLEMKKKRR